MEIKVEMKGNEDVRNMTLTLSGNLMKEIESVSDDFMSFVQKSAKLRAPHWTGELADSIRKGNPERFSDETVFSLFVDSPYGWFQETGWTPKFLGANTPTKSGRYIGDWMEFKGYIGFGIKPRGIAHPFIKPAYESAINHLPQMLSSATHKAVKESK